MPVLDLHCGLGFWVRDIAAIYSHWEVLGLDADMETIVFAQDLTPNTLRKHTQFLCDDLIELFLRPNCVNLVHARFLAPLIKPEEWPAVLRIWVNLCGVGDLFVWTEAQLQTNSPAWEKLYTLLQRAMGNPTLPNCSTPDVTPYMVQLVKDTACSKVEAYHYEFSLVWGSEHRQQLRTWSSEIMSLFHAFLLAKQVALLRDARTDLGNEQIAATITLVTIVNTLPTPHEKE